MTRLYIARQYGVDDWLISATRDHVTRDSPLTRDEIEQLGPELTAKVTALREEALRRVCVCRNDILLMEKLSGVRILQNKGAFSDDEIRHGVEKCRTYMHPFDLYFHFRRR